MNRFRQVVAVVAMVSAVRLQQQNKLLQVRAMVDRRAAAVAVAMFAVPSLWLLVRVV